MKNFFLDKASSIPKYANHPRASARHTRSPYAPRQPMMSRSTGIKFLAGIVRDGARSASEGQIGRYAQGWRRGVCAAVGAMTARYCRATVEAVIPRKPVGRAGEFGERSTQAEAVYGYFYTYARQTIKGIVQPGKVRSFLPRERPSLRRLEATHRTGPYIVLTTTISPLSAARALRTHRARN